MVFDWTINLGQVGVCLSFIGGLGVWALALKNDVNRLHDRFDDSGKRIDAIEASIKEHLSVLISVARQEERLDAHERQLEHLRSNIEANTNRLDKAGDEIRRFRDVWANGPSAKA